MRIRSGCRRAPAHAPPARCARVTRADVLHPARTRRARAAARRCAGARRASARSTFAAGKCNACHAPRALRAQLGRVLTHPGLPPPGSNRPHRVRAMLEVRLGSPFAARWTFKDHHPLRPGARGTAPAPHHHPWAPTEALRRRFGPFLAVPLNLPRCCGPRAPCSQVSKTAQQDARTRPQWLKMVLQAAVTVPTSSWARRGTTGRHPRPQSRAERPLRSASGRAPTPPPRTCRVLHSPACRRRWLAWCRGCRRLCSSR